jgi:hypothetical protein
LYQNLSEKQALGIFVESHVVCAWSYNALLRSLQKDVFTLSLPLNSDAHKEAIRILSELALEAEACTYEDGRIGSQLELYLEAMHDLGANTAQILGFFDIMGGGIGGEKAVEYADFLPDVAMYAQETMRLLNKPLHLRAAALFHEGEYFTPDRFLCQLYRLRTILPVERLLRYFENHIESIKHPGYSAADRLLEIFTGNDVELVEEADKEGEQIMRRKIDLWDATSVMIDELSQSFGTCTISKPRLSLVT